MLSHWYDERARTTPNPERAERLGTLVASGLIVGESLWGVLNAGLIVGLVEGRADRARARGLRARAVARSARVRRRDRLVVWLDVASVGRSIRLGFASGGHEIPYFERVVGSQHSGDADFANTAN